MCDGQDVIIAPAIERSEVCDEMLFPHGAAGLRGRSRRVRRCGQPAIKDVRLNRSKIGGIPCEWVLAPGADLDVRLLYLHGGGFVSGSGAL